MGEIRNTYYLKEKLQLNIALSELKRVNRYMLRPVKHSKIAKVPNLDEYFLRPVIDATQGDVEKDKLFEKTLYAAIITQRSNNMTVDDAKVIATTVIEEIRYTRIIAHHAVGNITEEQKERMLTNNYVATTITTVKASTRFLTRKGIKFTIKGIAATAGIASGPVGWLVMGCFLTWDWLVPEKMKTKIKGKVGQWLQPIKRRIEGPMKFLAEKAEKVVEPILDYLSPIVSTAAKKLQPIAQPIIDVISEIKKEVKPIIKKAKEKVKNFGKKILSLIKT